MEGNIKDFVDLVEKMRKAQKMLLKHKKKVHLRDVMSLEDRVDNALIELRKENNEYRAFIASVDLMRKNEIALVHKRYENKGKKNLLRDTKLLERDVDEKIAELKLKEING